MRFNAILVSVLVVGFGYVAAQDDPGFERLRKAGLKVVDLGKDGAEITLSKSATDADIDLLKLVKSRTVNFDDCDRITEAGLAKLKDVADLEVLRITKTTFADAALQHLRGHPKLRGINFTKTTLSDKGLAYLPDIPKLRQVFFSESRVTDEGLEHLSRCKNVGNLEINTVPGVSDRGIVKLANMKSLKILKLYALDKLTDKGIAEIAKLPDVNLLTIVDCKNVTDEGVASIKSMPAVAQLKLKGCSVTDKAVPLLLEMKNLSFLDVGRTSISPMGIEQLKKSRPALKFAN